jgi:hypothetical protein
MEQHPAVSARLFDRLHSMLVYDNIQINRERGNSGAGRSVCFGIVGKRSEPVGDSRWNTKRPEVWAELQTIAEHLPVPEGWTSCVLNQDYVALPHYDSGNIGPSMIVSFGCYSGGELVLEEASGTRTVSTYLTPISGKFSKTKHWTKPLSGVKFSLVFFKIDPTGGRSGRIKQKQLTAEDIVSFVDPTHMFNPLPAVSRVKNGRSYVAIITPNPKWTGLNNPKLIASSTSPQEAAAAPSSHTSAAPARTAPSH